MQQRCIAAATLAALAVGAAPGELTIERADPAYFELTIAEMRFSVDQPHLDVEATAETVRKVLADMGFNEHDYALRIHDEYGMPYTVDMSPVAEQQAEESKSAPALHYFRKNIQHIPGYGWEDGYRQNMGEMIIGVTVEWPSGKHHGSVTMGVGSDWFRTFCTVKGVGVCSDREDCLGHEIGHFFGLEHRRHDWYGFNPKPKHVRYIRSLASCTHVDAWQEEREEGWLREREGAPADESAPFPPSWVPAHHD